MNAKEFNESISKIAVDAETKQGILEVITIANASNMDTLLNEFRIFKSELKEIRSDFKSELRAIQEKSDSEFKIINSEFRRIEEKSSSELKRIEDKIDTKTTLIMSFIGFLIVLMVALKFIH